MIILRQKEYSRVDPEKLVLLGGAATLGALPGAVVGSCIGGAKGLEKSDKKDIEAAAKEKEKNIEKYIKTEEAKLHNYFPDNEEDMDNLDKVEYDMTKDSIKEAKKELKKLKQGNYENVSTKKSEKYAKIGGILGGTATAGLTLGGIALAKRLKKR